MLMHGVHKSYHLVPESVQDAVGKVVGAAFSSPPSGMSELCWRNLCSQILTIQISKDKDSADFMARFFGGDNEPYHFHINGRPVSGLCIVEMAGGYATMWQYHDTGDEGAGA